ncbi:MAG: hypothetical protein PHQ74_09035 [Crocinitomicaceae bacterium]|nr:hypothetical protein [Crocinitomicaceae bacterium]
MSINGKHKDITFDDLMSIAKENSIKKGKAIIENISKIVANWNEFAEKAKVEKQLTKTISKTHLKMHQ